MRETPDDRDRPADGMKAAQAAPAEPADLPALLDRVRGGDPESFGELYRRYRGRVFALAVRLSGNPTRAEDLTQEVFLQVWRKLDRFDGRSRFTTWLHRLTVNLVIDHLRAESRRAGREIVDDGWERVPESSPARPGDAADLEAAVRSLPPGARTVLVLHDLEGYRHEDIARAMGTAVGTSKAQLHRARRLLREKLR